MDGIGVQRVEWGVEEGLWRARGRERVLPVGEVGGQVGWEDARDAGSFGEYGGDEVVRDVKELVFEGGNWGE